MLLLVFKSEIRAIGLALSLLETPDYAHICMSW